jgi:hypothetical protein
VRHTCRKRKLHKVGKDVLSTVIRSTLRKLDKTERKRDVAQVVRNFAQSRLFLCGGERILIVSVARGGDVARRICDFLGGVVRDLKGVTSRDLLDYLWRRSSRDRVGDDIFACVGSCTVSVS